jgi:hypothetical protein
MNPGEIFGVILTCIFFIGCVYMFYRWVFPPATGMGTAAWWRQEEVRKQVLSATVADLVNKSNARMAEQAERIQMADQDIGAA